MYKLVFGFRTLSTRNRSNTQSNLILSSLVGKKKVEDLCLHCPMSMELPAPECVLQLIKYNCNATNIHLTVCQDVLARRTRLSAQSVEEKKIPAPIQCPVRPTKILRKRTKGMVARSSYI